MSEALRDALLRAVATPSGTMAVEVVDRVLEALVTCPQDVVSYLVDRGALRQVPLEATGVKLPRLFEIV